MCKHVLNAQVALRAPCCKKWFDCPECHEQSQDHELEKTTELVMVCKKCKKVFRKNIEEYEEADEHCPGCDNHYVVEAKTPDTEGHMVIEYKAQKGFEHKMYKDERERVRERVLAPDSESDEDFK